MGRGKRQSRNDSGARDTRAISAPPLCVSCVHRREALTCDAFPAGIPEAIIKNGHDHRQPYPGDNGITYEPKSADEPRFDPFKR